MNADLLIAYLLNESRKQLASINRKGAPAEVARFKRRAKAFRNMKRGGSDVVSSSLQKPFSSVPFQSPLREMSVKHLLPLLRFHMINKNNSMEDRAAAKQEYAIHIGIEDRRMDKAVRRTMKKLKGGGIGPKTGLKRKEDTVSYQTAPQDSVSRSWMDPHDAWDHGYVGALPSYHGETLATKMDFARNGTDSNTRIPLLQQGTLKAASNLPEHMKNIPLEHVLSWARTLRKRGGK